MRPQKISSFAQVGLTETRCQNSLQGSREHFGALFRLPRAPFLWNEHKWGCFRFTFAEHLSSETQSPRVTILGHGGSAGPALYANVVITETWASCWFQSIKKLGQTQ